MDLKGLLYTLVADGTFARLATNPLAQFGTRQRQYKMATLLPEKTVPENSYMEDGIRYRTIIANAGTRYSKVQLKGGVLAGSFNVQLYESDIGGDFTSKDYDALLRFLGRNATMDAVASLISFLDITVIQPLIEINELWRCQAIVEAIVHLRGDNEYSEDVLYSNPAGHRAAAAGAWSNDAVDPFDDIFAMTQLLASKGFQVNRIITSRKVLGIMGGNAKVQTRAGHIRYNAQNATVSLVGGRATSGQINAALQEDGLPAIETYDLMYQTNSSSQRFLPDTVMILTGTTGADVSITNQDPDVVELLPNTLGYMAVGRPAGQSDPGRVIFTEAKTDKPPRIQAQGWQTTGVVITEPEAVTVITGIA